MIDIKDIKGNVILSTPINEGSKRKFDLMQSDHITLRFSLDTPIDFPMGCYVDTAELGRFERIDSAYKPNYNNTTGGYDYELQLDAYYRKWKNKIFKFTPEVGGQEASWSLTASLDVQMSIFLRNLKALGYTYRGTEFEFSIDSTVENKAIGMTYDNMNMLDALASMAESWECEWWVTDNIIHFGRCEYGTPVDFEINVNVESMSRSESKSTYATRIYAFGSTKNLPASYRPVDESVVVNGVVQRRLMLPEGTPYVDAFEGMTEEEAVEQVVIFEDVYPRTKGTIDSIETYEDTVENEDGTTTTETFYRFKDSGITFSKDYILEGEELKVKFESGLLNGMEFGVVFNPKGVNEKNDSDSWNPEAQLFEIVVNEDYGRKLPDSTLKPQVGDTYILSGWDSTKIAELGLVAKAENELLTKAQQYVEKSKIDPNTYPCKMMSDYMYGLDEEGNLDTHYAKHFEVGDRVNLINKGLFKDGRQSRIIGYEYNLDYPYDSPTYTVGETASYSRIGDIETKLEALTYGGITYKGGGGSGVYLIGTNDTTKPTNRNAYSALRADQHFLKKDQPDNAREVITFEKGLNVGEFVTGASGASFFKDLTTGQTIMELDKLYVRMKAFFETLTIVEAQTISGKQIISPAGSVRCTNVEEYDDYYRCYFLNEQDGEKIENKFIVGDQAYSQMFNAKTGTSNKISNRYYWRLVTGVGENYIDLSKTDCDTDSDAPMVGDILNQRGHRYPENSERMNFIETSTVDGFSPSITLFHGVNSFSLVGKDYVQFGVDKTTNKAFMNVYGDMYVGDRNKTAYMRYTQEEGLVICGKLDVGTKLGDAYLKDLIAASTPEGYQEFVEKVTQDLEGLQAQIDGTIDSYFFQYEPSLDNYPASEWDTENEKKAHLNDTFTNLVDGRSWRWSLDGTYKWVEITDTATTKALALAGKANDTADGKRRVFVVTDEHPTPYPPYDKGDLWSRGSDYPLLICVVQKDASGVYAEGDFDYADNTEKLREEMTNLVNTTKAELDSSISSTKTAMEGYTDDAKKALQQSIDLLEETKAEVDNVYSIADADAKISAAEADAIKKAEELADAARDLAEKNVQAWADGEISEAEQRAIDEAQARVDAAKSELEEAIEAIDTKYAKLVADTKDELNNSIGQAKEAANKYADEGIASAKEDINASIAELEQAKANVTEVYSKAEADGKITEAETSAINAAKAQADAAIALSETTIKAYADGIVDDEEAARIKQAQENLAEAKKYAEEQAEAAKSEIENSYLFQALQDAQSTEIENGLVLTSLIQLRDTQSNIMSGINGLINASKGDKSIATWWGGGMYDLIDYYRWDGTQWVVKSGITAPSNIPSGLIRMDGTGYLAKGKFWWDNDGKIYADPTALFLSFDVNAEEGTLSATILDIRDKQTEFANMWSIETDSNGTQYLYSKYPLVSQGGVTMYAGTSGLDVEGIYDGLPIDGKTIYWDNGVLKAQGGGGGVADSVAWADITGKPSFATVATSGSYNDLLNKPTLLSSFTDDVVAGHYLPLSGGELYNGVDNNPLTIRGNAEDSYIGFEKRNGTTLGAIGINVNLGVVYWDDTNKVNRRLLHEGNYTSYTYSQSSIDSKLSGYLPLSGGTLTAGSGVYAPLIVKNSSSEVWVQFQDSVGSSFIGTNKGVPSIYLGSGSNMPILHSGNYSSYALPISGGTISAANTTPLRVNNSNSTTSGIEFRIAVNDANKAGFGWDSSNGMYLYEFTSKKYFGINTSGRPYFYDGTSSQTLLHAVNYSSYALPLTGGTLNNTGSDTPLYLRGNSSSTYLGFKNSNNDIIGYIGVTSNNSPTFYFNGAGYTLYHSGNLTKLSQLTNDISMIQWAGNHTEKVSSTTASSKFEGTLHGNAGVFYLTGSYNDANTPTNYGNIINMMGQGGGQLYCGWEGSYTTGKIFYRSHRDNTASGGWTPWKQLAFTDSNVASATKLATARTIWGQSFDGTGNVTGNLNLGAYGLLSNASGSDKLIIAIGGSGEAYFGYDLAPSKISSYLCGYNLYFKSGTSRSTAMMINASTNVTIGDSDYATTNYKLYVNGSLNATTIYQNGSSLDSLLGNYLPLSGGTLSGNLTIGTTTTTANHEIGVYRNADKAVMGVSSDCAYLGLYDSDGSLGMVYVNGSKLQYRKGSTWYDIWHSGNDGSGSGLDADTLDGYQPSSLNVASATKLQTPRTIWGQSFDGTGNVSGALSGVTGVTMTGAINQSVGENKFSAGSTFTDPAPNIPASTKFSGLIAQTGGNVLLCTTSGNVGIGTTSPGYKLDVVGASRSRYMWFFNTSFNGNAGYIGRGSGSNNDIYIYSVGSLRFGVNSTDNKMVLDTSANLLVLGGITMYSDIRKKTKLKDVELSLKEIADAPLIEHYYNSDDKKTTHVGSIAQYWAGLNDWFCKLDNEGYYTMEIQNAALASSISIARELVRYESETDKQIRVLKSRVRELEEEVKRLRA